MTSGDGELILEEGNNRFISRVEEMHGTKETRGEEEERGSGGEGTKGRGSIMTTRGGKPCKGDVAMGVRESKKEKKGESL